MRTCRCLSRRSIPEIFTYKRFQQLICDDLKIMSDTNFAVNRLKILAYKIINSKNSKLYLSLMTWINGLLEDERVFPSKIGVSFPPNFRDTAHRIMRRLFRIYAHIYCRHLTVSFNFNFLLNLTVLKFVYVYLKKVCRK